jgi:hypothetical protein
MKFRISNEIHYGKLDTGIKNGIANFILANVLVMKFQIDASILGRFPSSNKRMFNIILNDGFFIFLVT